MQRFRLRVETIAVHDRRDGKAEAVSIPAGSVIASVDPVEEMLDLDRRTLIPIEWSGNSARMFLGDLLERGQRVLGSGG
jgi:hypothetical protein